MSSTPTTPSAHQQSTSRQHEGPVQKLPINAYTRDPQGTLPAATAETEDDRDCSIAAPSSRRVLIVDDNHDAAHSLEMLLRLAGHEIRIAQDGREGVAAVQAFNPHVAILDIGMPQMNGYEAARAIRSEPWGRSVVLIAVTGWDNDEDRKVALDAGFDHHMCKPVDLAALTRVVATARTR